MTPLAKNTIEAMNVELEQLYAKAPKPPDRALVIARDLLDAFMAVDSPNDDAPFVTISVSLIFDAFAKLTELIAELEPKPPADRKAVSEDMRRLLVDLAKQEAKIRRVENLDKAAREAGAGAFAADLETAAENGAERHLMETHPGISVQAWSRLARIDTMAASVAKHDAQQWWVHRHWSPDKMSAELIEKLADDGFVIGYLDAYEARKEALRG